jgi:hypothetical protein
MGGGLGLLVVVAIVLVVVFTTKKKNDGGDTPDPTPPTPDGFNPYFVDPNHQNSTLSMTEGFLIFNTTMPSMKEFAAKQGVNFLGSTVKDDVSIGIDSDKVSSSRGVNNDFIKRVYYSFRQINYKHANL